MSPRQTADQLRVLLPTMQTRSWPSQTRSWPSPGTILEVEVPGADQEAMIGKVSSIDCNMKMKQRITHGPRLGYKVRS